MKIAAFLFASCCVLVGIRVVGSDQRSESRTEYWSVQTNGIRAGLSVGYSTNNATGQVLISCLPILENLQTNWIEVWLPPITNLFKISVRDEHGEPVRLTPVGKKLGGAITEPLRITTGINYRAGYRGCVLIPNQPQLFSDQEFSLHDFFFLTNSGKYRLNFEFRILSPPLGKSGPPSKSPPPVISFPPLEIELDIGHEIRAE